MRERMKALFVAGLLAVLTIYVSTFIHASLAVTPTTVTYQINASKDDAWSKVDDVEWDDDKYYLSKSDLRAGCRWSIDIPKGATIESAYYIGRAKSSSDWGVWRPAIIRIQAFDQDSCDDFDAIFWDWPVMPGYVDWTLPAFQKNRWYTSPDLKTIIQAYIDRAGYAVGNYIGLKFTWQSGREPGHEVWTWDANPISAAKLEVTYTAPVPKDPVADFAYSPGDPIVGETVTFDASASYDPDGTIVSYYWDFGDGTTRTETDPYTTHAYTAEGTYTVSLTVMDNDGLTDTVTQYITIKKSGSTISITASPTTITIGEGTTISGYITPTRVGVAVTTWYRLGGTETWSVLATTVTDENSRYSHAWTPSKTGTYKLKASWPGDASTSPAESPIITVDVVGAHDIAITDIKASATSVKAGDSVTISVYIKNEGHFTETFDVTTYYDGNLIKIWKTGVSLDAKATITLIFTWDTAGVAEGTYVISAEASVVPGETDAGDNTYTNGTITISVLKPPVASFIYTPHNPVINETVTFNASASNDSDGTIASYAWDFGDGTSDTGMIVTRAYPVVGSYNVTLVVTDNDGLNDTATTFLTIHVHDVAVGSVAPSTTEIYTGQVVNITVVVRNEGTASETFDVAVSYDDTVIEKQTITDLAPRGEKTLTFSWDTTGVADGASYTIKAEASVVPSETSTANNAYKGGKIRVSPQPTDLGTAPIAYVTPIGLALVCCLVAVFLWRMRRGGPSFIGFEFFDEMTGGGIPDAYSVMIIGGPGSGKSVLCQQLTYNCLTRGKACVYVNHDCFPDEVRENMKSFHWDTSPYEQKGSLRFVDCYSSIAGVASREKYYVERPFALYGLGIMISTVIDEAKQRSVRVVLDSTAPLFTRHDPQEVINFLQDRSARIKGDDGVFFFTVGKETVPSGLMSRLEEIVDSIIELDVHEEEGKTLRKLRIRKFRGRRFMDTWISFKVELKKGLTFLPPKGWSKSRK